MKIIINGEQTDIRENTSVSAMLTQRNVQMPDMVSVELNNNILDRKSFDTTIIQPGDKIELLYFMGGGQESVHNVLSFLRKQCVIARSVSDAAISRLYSGDRHASPYTRRYRASLAMTDHKQPFMTSCINLGDIK